MRRLFFLLVLLAVYLLGHLLIIRNQAIAFSFDHGKDSLAIMHMVVARSPKLIGPWTSIPGLYFGPGWYYLLAPFYFVLNFQPIAGAVAMMVLGVVQLIVVYKQFGRVPAAMVAGAPFWFAVTSSAWNPFPITLTSWIVLLLLNQLKEQPQSWWRWMALGCVAAAGFHFSTAFALLYLLFIPLGILIREVKWSLKGVILLVIGFLMPFIPQILFELRHQFVEVRGVLAYITGSVRIETATSPSSWGEVMMQMLFQTQSATMPTISTHSSIQNLFFVALIGILLVGTMTVLFDVMSIRSKRKRTFAEIRSVLSRHQIATEFLLWFSIGSVWFYFLHFNTWYLYGLMPVAVLFVSHVLSRGNVAFQWGFVGLLLLGSLIKIQQFPNKELSSFLYKTPFLPIKQQAIDLIYERAGDAPFASYHYEPDIYDFPYQYLYFVKAVQGKRLPTEFSYEPGVTPYIPEKAELLEAFATQIDSRSPEYVFFIVEKPQVDQFLSEWWDRQKYGQIIETVPLSDDLVVYMATASQ